MKYSSILVFINLYFLSSCKNIGDEVKPERKTITESVYSSVTVSPDSSYEVYSTTSGYLKNILVSEGDTVNRNSALFTIKNESIAFNLDNLKTALKQAEENLSANSPILRQVNEELASARLKRSNDSLQYVRQKSLWEKGIGSKTEYEGRKLAYELSRKNHEMAIARKKHSLSDLRNKLTQARNNYNSSLVNADEYNIKSKRAGTVYSINKEKGELINPQIPLATIGSSSTFILQMMIAEVDIVKIRVGQEILVTLDAYPKEIFKAKVTKIYPKKDERTQTFKVEGEFSSAPPQLYPGLSGEVNIVIRTKKDALTLPSRYVNDQNQVKTDTGLVKIEVGVRNLEFTEVISGITEDTQIYDLEE
ncbi:HlyD family efflux transporter periplasmic adaptor subunit [bacterium]|nr:HlyD family efflux transporter periplasmic adaptor subunit [bacterium]